MSSTRIASVMIALLGTVPVAFAILLSANGSHADDVTSLREYFIAKNPKDEHAQFQNTNIHLIYACTYARGVDPSGVCEDISAIAKNDGLVTYVKSRTEHEMGVNFLASDTTYPADLFQQLYGSCGFRNLPNRSIVIVKNQDLHDNLEGCLYTSSLIHLGFYVDKAISAQIDKKSFHEIIEYYVSSDLAP